MAINARFGLKVDTLENWKVSTLPLLKGEVAFATVASVEGVDLAEPVVMMKIGEDGVKTFNDLPLNFYAKASDVPAWAKKRDPELTELPTKLQTIITNLQNAVGEGGSVADAINAAIAALDVDEVSADTGKIFSSISEVDGKIVVSTRDLAEADIPELSIAKIAGLQDALDARVLTSTFTEYQEEAAEAIAGALAKGEEGVRAAGVNAENITKIIDGTTTVTKAAQDANGNVIADTYETKEDAKEIKDIADANAGAIATLIGDVEGDDALSVREIAVDEVAKVVAGADADYDTLKEIADFILNDNTGAAGMSNKINANAAAIEDIVDGTTTVTKASQDANGNVIADTYETKEDATSKNTEMDTRVKALEDIDHDHTNKAVLDGITEEKVAAWDAAETNANEYTDEAVGAITETLGGYGNIVTHSVDEFATAEQGEKADSAVQTVTNEENCGIKVTQSGTGVTIGWDPNVTLIFDCGTSK